MFFIGLFLIVGGAENAGIVAQFLRAGDYVNLHASEYYMGALYLIAIAIYVGSRLYRKSQGVDLKMVYDEIPAE